MQMQMSTFAIFVHMWLYLAHKLTVYYMHKHAYVYYLIIRNVIYVNMYSKLTQRNHNNCVLTNCIF